MAKNTPDDTAAAHPAGAAGSSQAIADLAELVRRLAQQGGLPVAFSQAQAPRIDTAAALNLKPRVTVAFPPCSEELLSLIRPGDPGDKDEIAGFFSEYFKFGRHTILGQDKNGQELGLQLDGALDPNLLICSGGTGPVILRGSEAANHAPARWPSECCLCAPCVMLDGNRNRPPAPLTTEPRLRRLFLGDAFWLFYMDRLGIPQILGAILDAFAGNGRLPISNGSLDGGVRDDLTALVLEVMVRQTKMAMSSLVRDRTSLFMTTLGWVSETGRPLNVDAEINTGFNTLFHKFLFHALEFYRDKRLAVAIQGAAGGVARPSVATLITISETLDVLKKRFEAFDYGRNYYNTLSGIVWMIAGMSVVRELRTTLGIPPAFGDPHEYIPAAYDILVMKRSVTHGDTNRFVLHRECARNGRDVLLDLEVVNHLDGTPGGALEHWLSQVESKIESYRTAYRSLTGVDLGASATPAIEQKA
jgi:hypothetical protein